MNNEIKIIFTNEYKSFKKNTEYTMFGNFIILSGINGAGKSQLLDSLKQTSVIVTINNELIINRDILKYSFKDNVKLPEFGKYSYDLAEQNEKAILSIYRAFVNLYKKYQVNKDNFEKQNMTEEKYYLNNIHISMDVKLPNSSNTIPRTISPNTVMEIINSIKEKNEQNLIGLTDTEVLNSMPSNFIIKLIGEEIDGITRIFTEASKQRALELMKYGSTTEVFDNEKWLKTAPWTEINNLFEKLNFNYRFAKDFEYAIPFLKENPKLYAFENGTINKQKIRSIDDLSDGEKAILKLVIASYDRKKDNTTRLLLLDEYDATLNPSLIKDFFTVLEEYYINKGIIVILSTHSPATLALAPENARFYEIFRKNDSSPIIKEVNALEYEELRLLEKYYDKIKNPSVRLKELEKENENLKTTISTLETPLIVTEGKTDWKHIKNAKIKLNNLDTYNFFEFFNDMGDTELLNMLKEQAKISNPNKRIFIFDNDNKKILPELIVERL